MRMTFKLARLITLMGSFLIGCLFCFAGGIAIFLPWLSSLQAALNALIVDRWFILTLWGVGFCISGLALILFALLQLRHRSVQIRTGDLSIVLDEAVIRHYLDSYWSRYFPDSIVPYTLTMQKKELIIAADLPQLSIVEQKKILEEVKNDLNQLFVKTLGYPYDVHLIASFK